MENNALNIDIGSSQTSSRQITDEEADIVLGALFGSRQNNLEITDAERDARRNNILGASNRDAILAELGGRLNNMLGSSSDIDLNEAAINVINIINGGRATEDNRRIRRNNERARANNTQGNERGCCTIY